ncbi:MAG: 1-acyl-sn-glycerol-3-phosphate acyltransferase [Magnetovibrio sp.]|nr:1-acyl-sn-glycerol-3-phosphate acyltransferase [Magnetovibrio sp.]
MMFSNVRAGINIALFLSLVGILLPPYVVCLGLAPKKRHLVGQLFFKGCLKLTGLKLNVTGAPSANVALFAANHSSYLDILVLGACVREGVFVAKSEVASWPLFGFLARLSRTLFISRNPKDALHQRKIFSDRLKQGTSLILFPEGTSTNGSHVKTFKSTLFSALDDISVKALVQPVSVTYTRHKNGQPLSPFEREKYTWFGDMTLAPHLINVFGSKGCEVEVVFHAPFVSAECFDRKQLAKACENIIADQVKATLATLKPIDTVIHDQESVPLFIGAE